MHVSQLLFAHYVYALIHVLIKLVLDLWVPSFQLASEGEPGFMIIILGCPGTSKWKQYNLDLISCPKIVTPAMHVA